MLRRVQIKVTGDVQGVSFRVTALRMAKKLGLAGFVRNAADGSVVLEAEGAQEQLDKFVDFCRVGPQWAEVENISVTDITPVGSSEFDIL